MVNSALHAFLAASAVFIIIIENIEISENDNSNVQPPNNQQQYQQYQNMYVQGIPPMMQPPMIQQPMIQPPMIQQPIQPPMMQQQPIQPPQQEELPYEKTEKPNLVVADNENQQTVQPYAIPQPMYVPPMYIPQNMQYQGNEQNMPMYYPYYYPQFYYPPQMQENQQKP